MRDNKRPLTHKALSFVILCLFLSFSTFISVASAQPATEKMPIRKLPNLKVISPIFGEVTSHTGYVGESLAYKIYYGNVYSTAADIRIVDKVDPGLKNIEVKPPGKYDPSQHVVVWEFKRVAAGKKGFVEFSGILSKSHTVTNQARIQFSTVGKLPPIDIKALLSAKAKENIAETDLKKMNLGIRPILIATNRVRTDVYASPRLGWIPFEPDAKEGALPQPAIKDTTTSGVMINFNIPGVFVRKVTADKVVFHRFSMPGQAVLTDLGKPELPIIGEVIEVPHGVNFSIEIIKSREVVLDHYRVFPAQRELVDVREGDRYSTPTPTKFEIDKKIYLKNRWYPEALAAIQTKDIGVIRGHRIVMLKVNPIQYNPVTHETKGYAQIEVRVKYSKPAQVKAIPKRLYSGAFEKYLKNLLINYQDPKRFNLSIDAKDDSNEKKTGCDYLILTHNTFYNANDPNNPLIRLANWKTRKGLKTQIVDVATITNGQTYDGIRQYLQNAYDKWQMVPSYVLLVGDADQIPVRYLTGHSSHGNTLVGTDLYYSTLDGSDDFPDIYLGRLPVETQAQATAAIDRIINYEEAPPNNAGFYRNVMISALFEDTDAFPLDGLEDGTEDRPWIENVEDIRNFLVNQGYQVDRIYTTSSGWPADPNSDQPANYENGNALPAAITPPGFGWNATRNDVINGINAGRYLVTYRDHGSRDDWSSTGFDDGDAAGLTNGNLAPVIFSIACQTGWFDNETDDAALNTANNDESFCEHFLRNTNGGAVAIIGSTRNSYTGLNDFMMFGMHKAIWPAYVPNPPITGYPAVPTMDSNPLLGIGQIMTFGKVYMARCYNPGTSRTITFEMYHVFGDPELPVWTAEPERMEVSHPKAIGSTGEQDFVVKVTNVNTHVPINMARVVVSRDNSLLAVQEANAAGIARFKFASPASGSLDVTVTSLEYRPYLGSIKVSAGGANINRLDPDNGVVNQTVHVGGLNFDGSENVEITFDGQLLITAAAADGSFGQVSQSNVDIQVPSPHDLGPVNVIAQGNNSNRIGVDVFQIRSQNPIDLYSYDQWDSSTWFLHPGDNPTWDNPSIRLYDSANNLVSSNNLRAGFTYTVKADVHNDTDFEAKGVRVTFKWANFGIGQPPNIWTPISNQPTEINVPAHSVVPAEVKWTTPGTGHICIMAEIYHIEDINSNNNTGQENCHVGETSSPVEVRFMIWNPTKEPQMVYLEMRQLVDTSQQQRVRLWDSIVLHPEPQLLKPGERGEARVLIDPAKADVKPGDWAEFSLTGFIKGSIIGGVNFRITKK
jgi:hypothetical protein